MPENPPVPVRYVILLELLRRGPLRASELVDPTELTLQGVSYNLKQLEGEGLVAFAGEDRRAARITEEGIEELHDGFLGLKAFVDLALSEMLHVEECVALAGTDLEPGEEVGLFMHEGRLVARLDESPSTGRVRVGGSKGDLVVVDGLTGVVDLDLGAVHVVELPPLPGLPDPSTLVDLIESAGIEPAIVATSGLEAEHLVERAGIEAAEGSVRFAAARVARSASQVGLEVLLVVSAENVAQVRSVLEGEGPEGEGVPTRVHEL